MAIKRPITFPQRNTLNGTEELYTQYGGVNYKFTLDQISEYMGLFVDEGWLSREIIVDNTDLQSISTIPVQILDEADLASGECYEISRITIEAKIGTTAHIQNADIYFLYKENAGSTYFSSEGFLKIPTTLIEATYNAFYVSYISSINVKYLPENGVFLQSSANSGGGDTQFKITIYYKISST